MLKAAVSKQEPSPVSDHLEEQKFAKNKQKMAGFSEMTKSQSMPANMGILKLLCL